MTFESGYGFHEEYATFEGYGSEENSERQEIKRPIRISNTRINHRQRDEETKDRRQMGNTTNTL